MNPLLPGLHDISSLKIAPPGTWVLDTIALSANPMPASYLTSVNIIVRVNWGYGSTGTLPVPDEYPGFAQRIANYVKGSTGCKRWIIGNEPNASAEWPDGQPIFPAQYAACYKLCRQAIHAIPGHEHDEVLIAGSAPWNAELKYPGNVNGDWIKYFADVIAIVGGACDGFALHAYTHGYDPALVTSTARMDAPFQNRYYNFRTYLDYCAAIPESMHSLPVYLTEADGNGPWQATGLMPAMLAEIDTYNQAGKPKIHCVIFYRYPKYDQFFIEGKDDVIAEYLAAVGRGYSSPDTLDSTGAKSMPDTTYLPSISHDAPSSTLPPRQIDPRLTQRGTTIEEASVSPGTSYFRLNEAQFFDHTQAGGRHHVYVEAVDERGAPLANIPFTFSWPSGKAQIVTNGKSGFDAANQPFSEGRNAFNVAPADAPGDAVKGIGMGEDDPGGWNAGEHTATLLRFQRVSEHEETPSTPKTAYVAAQSGLNLRSAPGTGSQLLVSAPYGDPVQVIGTSDNTTWSNVIYQGQTGWMLSSLLSPTPPTISKPQPQPPAGTNWERARAYVARWEGGWADNPADPGGATNKGITIGTFTKWREAHGQGTPTKDDLRNISDAEADQIFYEQYWLASHSDQLPWPLCLANFNAAVNTGPGQAKKFLAESDGDFLKYMAAVIDWYTTINGWPDFGAAWTRRNADLLREAA
jgi:uncharacterized protein YgiM (DUF1202 family)